MTRQLNEFSWKIGGQAGFGVQASGEIFARTCVRAGLHAFDYSEYPSVIRSGHCTYQVAVSSQPVTAWRGSVQMLVALDRETLDLHIGEVSSGGAVIYDRHHPSLREFEAASFGRPDVQWHGLPLGQIALDHQAELLMRNTVALGASFALLSLDPEFPARVIQDLFSGKGEQVVAQNQALLKAGYTAIPAGMPEHFAWDLNPINTDRRMFVTGNEAIGLGALQAGCKFYVAYPMTPSSTILHFLAEHGPKYGMLVRHAEDEIAVINETIGAAYAGVRAMCGTAGGGFALMTEAVGLAGMTEVGVVIVEGQRGGPSTGLPTWTEQGDLRQVLHAGQGDFLKIVLAPGDVEECFSLIQRAFHLAERFQTPVMVMTDKYLAEGRTSVEPFKALWPIDRGQVQRQPLTDDSFRRYATDTPTGVSERTLPGTPHGLFVANSDEHNAYGFTNEDSGERVAQMDKRARKAEAVLRELPEPILIGPAKADVTVIGWGSSKGIIQSALERLKHDHGITANHLHLWQINPFPVRAVRQLLAKAHLTVLVEGNQSGQFAGWLREQTGIEPDHHLRRYDGRPFNPEQLAVQLKACLR